MKKLKIKLVATLILLLALLVPSFLIDPAIAKSEQKIPAAATLRFPTVTPAERVIETNGGIQHFFGTSMSFLVDLTLDEPFDGQTSFTGIETKIYDFTTNSKTGNEVYHSISFVWTFDEGRFAGILQARTRVDKSGLSQVYEESLVLQGSGIFQGCTLKLSQMNNQPYTGLLLVSASAN